MKKQDQIKYKTKCSHYWKPIAIDVKYGFTYYKCLACNEVCWVELDFFKNNNLRKNDKQ